MLASTVTFVIGKVAVLPGEEKVEDADIRNVYRGIRRVGRHSEISMVVFYDIYFLLSLLKEELFYSRRSGRYAVATREDRSWHLVAGWTVHGLELAIPHVHSSC